MTMTRNDYALLARALAAAREDIKAKEPHLNQQDLLDGVAYAADQLADLLSRQNARFDPVRFKIACGVRRP